MNGQVNFSHLNTKICGKIKLSVRMDFIGFYATLAAILNKLPGFGIWKNVNLPVQKWAVRDDRYR